jgi:hypothetical protein
MFLSLQQLCELWFPFCESGIIHLFIGLSSIIQVSVWHVGFLTSVWCKTVPPSQGVISNVIEIVVLGKGEERWENGDQDADLSKCLCNEFLYKCFLSLSYCDNRCNSQPMRVPPNYFSPEGSFNLNFTTTQDFSMTTQGKSLPCSSPGSQIHTQISSLVLSLSLIICWITESSQSWEGRGLPSFNILKILSISISALVLLFLSQKKILLLQDPFVTNSQYEKENFFQSSLWFCLYSFIGVA